MFNTQEYNKNVSLALSEVLCGLGVNKKMLMKTRRVYLLQGTIWTISHKLEGINVSTNMFGSRIEGSTTPGLRSDEDLLICNHNYNVMQDWTEWKPIATNLLMIKDASVSAGYCLLQLIRSDVPLPATFVPDEQRYVMDRSGRVLLTNDTSFYQLGCKHGPAHSVPGREPQIVDNDFIIAYPCRSWPYEAREWLHRQGVGQWPTTDMKRYVEASGCLVVPVGRQGSVNETTEWRISTSHAERCLMFSLNATQIRYYILMKMILKTYIHFQGESPLSSFMCKTVLLHCIENTHSKMWSESNILNCLIYCLVRLHDRILHEECRHFMIPGNNLMEGKFSADTKQHLLRQLRYCIHSNGAMLFGIQTDNLGQRLYNRLSVPHQIVQNSTIAYSGQLLHQIVFDLSFHQRCVLSRISQERLEMTMQILLQTITELTGYYRDGSILEQRACSLLAPLLCSTYGSLLASLNFQVNNTVSHEALSWLSAGMNSDLTSGRLKLSSVLYCAGDMEITENILKDIGEQYDFRGVESVCCCYEYVPKKIKAGLGRAFDAQNEEVIKNTVALCVRFIPGEMNCVPKELQYEFYRSTLDDLVHRDGSNHWMDWTVVDSLTYLYFLKYKTYNSLHRHGDKQQALTLLAMTIDTENNLCHRETALNLLGQCLEQDNKPLNALHCYMMSLNIRERNNAANIHVSRLLAKLVNERA